MRVFESSVNPEGSKTMKEVHFMKITFESSVNPEGSKTNKRFKSREISLRVV